MLDPESTLGKVLFCRVRIRWRSLALVASVALLAAAAMAVDAWFSPPPKFALAIDQGSVTPVAYPWWRRVGDWLVGHRYVVLTFDDGPYGRGVDHRILRILRRHHAHAIFFLVCSHVRGRRVAVVRRILKAGDIVGNHSADHPHLLRLGRAAVTREIGGCSRKLARVTGRRPRYFRPPFGQTSARIRAAVRRAGMRQVLWDANSEDSWLTRPGEILHWSLEETHSDSILLMHDRPATAAALDRVLSRLQRRGFRFVLPPRNPPVRAAAVDDPGRLRRHVGAGS